MFRFILFASISHAGATWAEAETIDVKYYGPLDLKTFACTDVTRSSFVNRACHDDGFEPGDLEKWVKSAAARIDAHTDAKAAEAVARESLLTWRGRASTGGARMNSTEHLKSFTG